jgi:endonuclease/exonuclease/phosphatase family metal-dependent hydrolase
LTPEVPGSKNWDAAITRIVSWLKLKDKQTGNIFYHFNTHFDHIGVQARAESAKLIMKKIKEIAGNAPVILTGDFNCSDKEEPYAIIVNPEVPQHLFDAKHISQVPHHGPDASFAGNFRIDGLTDHRIDFIFVSGKVNVIRHAVLSDNWHGNLASDHLPVMATLRF